MTRLLAPVCLLALALPAAAQPVPVVEAQEWTADERAEPMAEGEVFSGCSLGCAIGWTTTASSTLPAQGANAYDAIRMEDGRVHTAWVEGVEGDGVGERLVFRLDPEGMAAGETVPLWGFDVVNGYAKDARTWGANGRVHELLISVNGRPAQRVVLQDTMRPQHAYFPGVEVGAGYEIAVEIRSVYPGTRHHDTALSEFILHGAH